MDINEYKQEVLNDINNCFSTCNDIQSVCLSAGVERSTEWFVKNLPALDYTKDRMLNYIFSNGLSSGSLSDNDKLDNWLYEVKNGLGSTNYSVLRNAIGEAAVYGECGLRLYKGALYTYHKGHYGILYTQGDGITEIVAYFIRKDEGTVDEDFAKKIEEWEEFQRYEDVAEWFDRQKLILLDPSEFVNLRNDTSSMHGKSPFDVDKLRVDLLLNVYQRLNYDIEYDGPGRIIVRPKAGFVAGDENDVSSSQVILNNGVEAQRQRYNDAMAEIRRVSNEIKTSSSDAVIALSQGFGDKIEHLPRVTKATEFFGWIDNEGVVIAELLGMSPVLMEAGKWSGNVSMSSIIDNAVLNTIVPMREKYAVQFSKMIASYLGIQKVYFDKYDLKQIDDENESRAKLAVSIRDLCYASKSLTNDNPTEGAASTGAALNSLISEFAQLLQTTLYDDYGNFKTL